LSALHQVDRLAGWLTTKARGEKIVLLLLLVGLPLLMFYNLELNPRPWHDEGASLILARTLAEDGVYAMCNSDGYQTFGPVQSVGPTVIVPVALVYRWFGVGLLQGRVVVALYALAALFLFYLAGRKLFDGWTAILGLFFLLAAPAVRIFVYGREVLGEVPGLAFFLAGWLALARALETRRLGWAALAGLLFGATIITKSQYLMMIPATLVFLAALDLLYYRQKVWKPLALVTMLALGCSFAWQVWQIGYYGMQSYQADLAKLQQLAAVTTGFHLQTAISGIRGILGSDSGNFYLFWGFPALGYAAWRAFQRSPRGLLLASVVIFTTLWLLYFTFWTVSWHRYALPAMALLALLIASLYLDLLRAVVPGLRSSFLSLPAGSVPPRQAMLAIGTLIGLLSYGLWAGYNLQQYLRSDVLDRYGEAEAELFTPPQFQAPGAVAAYLAQHIPPGSLIETWERELGILTDFEFHYPDQSMLAAAHKDEYLGEQSDYQLGEDYFQQVQPDYVIVGFYSRLGPIYDMDYLARHSQKIWSTGSAGFQYDIYKMNR
jgi:4-amino-4-deoxy-L-arabinose transferase-like glycosyltransferase